ncbi:uncharacterized protein DUF397 [Haloactinospora alba]|uniref:Uncharacterized protein DUF397 n=1 Tax=Haloactinospora alba TaxID=405555 RepID=A0A543NJT6_9ACTN|nr:DUF397 domain-containing protein [Haloactinospora alba]TQN32078.1 uncharacterized protein DUF397 [Haloactinospora alba]
MNHPVFDSLFRKSSYSQPNNNNCVEVADLPEIVAVRDSQHRQAGHLTFGMDGWVALMSSVKRDLI